MKKILLLMLAIPLVSFASAQSQSREEKKLLTTLYYELNEVFASYAELDKLDDVIDLLVGDPTLKVKIEGYGDPMGGKEVNDRVSFMRAKSTAEYMVRHNVSESQIIFEGKGIDTSAQSEAKARRVDVSQITRVAVVAEQSKPESKPSKPESKLSKPESELSNTESELSKPESELSNTESTPEENNSQLITNNSKCSFSLRTNLLYLLTGNINLGAEYKINSLGILLNGGYSPFAKTEWHKQLGSWFVAPELRYYLGEKEAWYIGAQFLKGGYNYKLSDTGYIGDMIGGGVTGGYKLPLSDCLDMDFTVGLGYGTLSYDTYYKHENGQNIYIDKDVKKNSFMPVQLGVSLIFKL